MRVGLCFRHFSSWSQQLPHGGMQQECPRQLPGIRESLCGNRRGWRREQVKEVWQRIAHFWRCPAHFTEWVNSRTWVKCLKHGKVHQGELENEFVCISFLLFFSLSLSLTVRIVSPAAEIINWRTDVTTDWHAYISTAELCVCSS